MDYASSLLSFLPGGRRSPGISQLLAKAESYLPPEQVERIQEAYDLASEAHKGQKRLTGEAYITHPVAVAGILADLHLDGQTVCAALLHDVIEDTPTAKDEILERFGREIAELVDGVSKLDKVQFKSRKEAQAESFRKMILAMVRDIRVIMVKLADRTHNMRTLGSMPPAKRRRIALETLEIYAPIANRLGIHSIKLELENLGFQALYPQRYKVLERELKKTRGNQKEFLPKIEQAISTALGKAGVKNSVGTREKHLYSVYQKMRRKKVSLAEVIDVFGLRVVVDSIDACYRTLGVVHGQYKPMPGRFKDYIAIPRINGYQSLHTTLFGPNGVPLEVQIRTEDMHRLAENGIAAHWQYKSGEEAGASSHDRAREWLAGLMDMQDGGNPEEFFESVKVDLFPDKVYVFTPKGDILRLPRGSTCVDFAYAVHSEVGRRCVAAKMDRRLVPLRTALRNGQTVEVITAKGATPNPAWANFVVTAKARAAIRAYLKTMKSSEAVDLGKRLVNQALAEFSLTLKAIDAAVVLEATRELGFVTSDELFEKVGLGERLAPLVARHLLPADRSTTASAPPAAPLAIAGTEGLVVNYARCCFPIPYDPIIAFLSAGRGVVIHRATCPNLSGWHKQPDKWLPVTWQKHSTRSYDSELKVEVQNRPGVLASVASAIAATHTNIGHVSVVERDADTSTIIFELQVRDRAQLARVIRAIRSMSEVMQIERSLA
ncbi:MAG: bifunctional (p)ppGpp synthetase/guanosine-3',5'-bis(diphosphate) 3'-pyrophosphohydrolase [Pseudomonadota bacterium]